MIKANLIEMHVGDFDTEKDKETFDVFCEALFSMSSGVVITPLYSDEGELMSFTVDSKRAYELLRARELNQ